MVKLTVEEKAIVSRYLSEDMSLKGALKLYWPWLVPFLGAAAHGFLYKDIISSFIANVLFIFYTYWFLSQGGKDGKHLQSAIQKYEAETSALGK